MSEPAGLFASCFGSADTERVSRMKLEPIRPWRSLSARLLVLTVFFVMVAEFMIYAPSIARFRLDYLQDRISSAHLASLALKASSNETVGAELEVELLKHVMAHGIALKGQGRRELMLASKMPPEVDKSYDLRMATMLDLLVDAFATLVRTDNRVLRVVGRAPQDMSIQVEVLLDEKPLRRAMLKFSSRIIQLSIVISLFTAGLVYLSLQLMMVRPMRRITASMEQFRSDPENPDVTIQPSERSDEIGVAQRELAVMQTALRNALHQKNRLAALGEGMTKVNHDLRGMLATAMLAFDRLEQSEDPEIRRVAPRIIRAIDRAVALCSKTMRYAREGPEEASPTSFNLHDLIAEVGEALSPSVGLDDPFEPAGDKSPEAEWLWVNNVPADFVVTADRAHLFRIADNLGRNAVEAGARTVTFTASTEPRRQRPGLRFVLTVADDGPGIPEKISENLFKPFSASTRKGGSGLGLSLSRELVQAHGGDIILTRNSRNGCTFRLSIPMP